MIGTCFTTEGGREVFWIADCNAGPLSGKISMKVRDLSGRTSELVVDSKAIRDIGTRKISKESFFFPNDTCPLCGGKRSNSLKLFSVTQLFWDVDVVECQECGLAYKDHFPRKTLMTHIYSQGYGHFSAKGGTEEESKQYLSRVRRLGRPRGRHLDYGCGRGGFVESALRAGWDSHGADPNLPQAQRGVSLDGRLHRLDVRDSSAADVLGSFDCITLWAVMEHLSSPWETMKGLMSLLNPGGVLLFNAPNAKSLVARRSGSAWTMAVLIEHLLFFSPACVHWISKTFGLRIEKLRISGTPFPFGHGDRGCEGQGLPSLPFSVFTLKDQNNSNQKEEGRRVVNNRALSLLSKWVLAKGGTGFFSNLTRLIINEIGIGDHIEVVLVKE